MSPTYGTGHGAKVVAVAEKNHFAPPSRSRYDRFADLIGHAPGIAEVREWRHILEALSPAAPDPARGRDRHRQESRRQRDSPRPPRSGRPFVDLNCAAIQEGLLEAKLSQDRANRAEIVNGGDQARAPPRPGSWPC